MNELAPKSHFNGLIAGLIILVLLLVFILENTKSVKVAFFGASGHLSLGIALLLSALAGGLIVGPPHSDASSNSVTDSVGPPDYDGGSRGRTVTIDCNADNNGYVHRKRNHSRIAFLVDRDPVAGTGRPRLKTACTGLGRCCPRSRLPAVELGPGPAPGGLRCAGL